MRRLSPGSLSWAMYDWANSAWALCILTTLFWPFYQRYFFDGPVTEALALQGRTVSLAGILVALGAPLLGALADRGRLKKKLLAGCLILGATATAAFTLVGEGQWLFASTLYLFSALGFFGGNVLYDGLLSSVSHQRNRHLVSGLGFSLGFLGSVLLLIAQVVVIQNPSLLGLPGAEMAVKLAFLSVAVWWVLFAIPLFRHVPEPVLQADAEGPGVNPIHEVAGLIKEMFTRRRDLLLMLLAYWFYIDGVNTLSTMATSVAAAVGFELSILTTTIIVVQLVGIPCALLFGWLGQRFGPRPFIYVALLVYLGVTLSATRLDTNLVQIGPFTTNKFLLMGIAIGLVQGGLQALSRSLFASLVPVGREAGYFGIYNMLGKGGAVIGPMLLGIFAAQTGDPRAGVVAIAGLFLLGGVLLAFVPVRKRESSAR